MANAFVVQSLAMLLVSANLLLTPSSAKMFIIIMRPSSSDSFFPPKVNPVVSPPTPNNPKAVTIFISTQGQRFWVSQVVLVVKKKKPTSQCTRCKRHRFDPWIQKVSWRKAWQPTPLFLSGESHGQRRLAGSSPKGHRKLDTTKEA